MNVASLELCKELYELSGWSDTDYTYYANAGQHSGTMMHRSLVFDKPENLPAYDAGCLLSKLPRGLIVRSNTDEADWVASYMQSVHYANTPEDALCKIAIELFDLGDLSK